MTIAPEAPQQGRNATAERAIDVLLLFDEEHPFLTASDIARRLDMPRSTTYRYIQTLRSYNLIEEDARGGFRLGTRIFQLGRIARQGLGYVDVARSYMEQLAALTGEVVLLTRRSGSQVVCVERVEGDPRHPIRLSYERGHVLPLHAGASAKVLLAFSDPAENDAVLSTIEALPRYTERTVTDRAALARQLERIRADGYALSAGEVDEGVRGIAAPIFQADGRVAAGLSLVGPQFRLKDAALKAGIAAVRQSAIAISARLREIDW
ncbi:MAG: IclR family transcriptional regulator [Chloroflexi bacterium]|nr:IclR family transcriptional regulator [Chloroflexota bacterium]